MMKQPEVTVRGWKMLLTREQRMAGTQAISRGWKTQEGFSLESPEGPDLRQPIGPLWTSASSAGRGHT
jgi:hypothetical protein